MTPNSEKNLDCFADERVKTTFALNCHLLWLFIFQKSYSTSDDDREYFFSAEDETINSLKVLYAVTQVFNKGDEAPLKLSYDLTYMSMRPKFNF